LANGAPLYIQYQNIPPAAFSESPEPLGSPGEPDAKMDLDFGNTPDEDVQMFEYN
jgi:hypothetical protein